MDFHDSRESLQKYVQNLIPEEKITEVFSVLHDLPDNHDFFITVCADIDLIYKILYNTKRTRLILNLALLDIFYHEYRYL